MRLDPGAAQARTQRGGRKEIVDTPADAALAGRSPEAPPGVVAGAFFELAKRVDEARRHILVEVGALLGTEAGTADVLLGPGDVDLLVGDVEIAADHHGLGGFQPAQVGEKIAVPTPAEGQTDRKSTRLNSSHVKTSYAVFCL